MNVHRTCRQCRHLPDHVSLKRPIAACLWLSRQWAGFRSRSKWVPRDILRPPDEEAMAVQIVWLLEDDGLWARRMC